MKRSPTIHIRKSDLVKILGSIDYSVRTSAIALANAIIVAAQPYQLKDRYTSLDANTLAVRRKIKKQLEIEVSVSSRTVKMFKDTLYSYRQSLGHRPRQITKDSPQYQVLMKVAKNSQEFVKHFNLTPSRDGHKEYILLGMQMMRKFQLSKMVYYDQKIYDRFEDKLTVLTDTNREASLLLHTEWSNALEEYTGLKESIVGDYGKFSNIVLAREEADKAGADYFNWVTAQFEGLIFMDVVPELGAFYGDNAVARYKRYMSDLIEENITDKYD